MATDHPRAHDASTDPPARRRRGRPVSLRARQAVLSAAAELLDQRGFAGFTVDEVSRRSGVSKATIYKHWTGGYHLAVDAYGDTVTDAVPVIATGDAVADLTSQIIRLAGFYASRRGQVIAELLAAGTAHPAGADLLREKFFAKRRTDTVILIEQGKADGQLRADIDAELAIDLLFGPIVFRLFNGLAPIDTDNAVELAHMALRAITAS
jgi:AcrR family transcriptional regulator